MNRAATVPPPSPAPTALAFTLKQGLLLAIFSLVATIALVEIALRLWGFSYRLYPEKIEFGWPNPAVMKDRYTPDNDLLWVPRDYPETLAEIKNSMPKVIFMGDSCTEFGTYDKFFAERAKARGLDLLPVAKVGSGGWTSYQGRRQLERDIAPLRPPIVTLYFGWNDHWIGFGIQDKEIGKLRSPLFTLLEHSRFVQLIVKAVLSVGQDKKKGPLLRVSEDDFRENLRAMVKTARDNGIVPVLLTAPSSHQRGKEPAYLRQRHLKNLSELVPLHQRYVSIVREIAAETQAPLCDLAADFAALPADELAKVYFSSDGIHLTKQAGEGYDRLAEFLVKCFEEHKLFGTDISGKNSHPNS